MVDTHALYWYTAGDSRLSVVAATVIQDLSNQILMSPASYWEIAIKVSLGKWILHRPYTDFLNACLNQYGFTILPIEPQHTAVLTTLPYHHKDPFDRLLVAQSLVEGIPIISADPHLDPYGITRIW